MKIIEIPVYGFAEVDGYWSFKGTHCWSRDYSVFVPEGYVHHPEDYIPYDPELGFDDEYYFTGGYAPLNYIDPIYTLQGGLKKLFVNTSLQGEDIKKLNEQYIQMLSKCIFAFIDNALQSNNVQLGNISINETMIGVGGVSPKGNLTFGGSDLITSNVMEHEWIHLFQRYILGIDIFSSTNKGMSEFEVKLIEFLEFSVLFGNTDRNYNVSNGYKFGISTYEAKAFQEIFNHAKRNCF